MHALREYLKDAGRGFIARPASGNFRLAIDRSFILPGAGLVVAGAVLAGAAHVGDELIVSPQGAAVRVRGIHAQNRPADVALAGQRCALNIAGSDLRNAEVGRGDWLVAAAAHAPTDRFDVHINVLPGEARPLAHWTPVHLHIGAAVVNARVAVLVERAIAPGQSGIAQLVLDAPVAALHGDRFVLRDQSAQRTIAGGNVIDPFGPARGRSKPARLVQLGAMANHVTVQALKDLLDVQPEGVDLDRFAQARNLLADDMNELRRTLAIRAVNNKVGALGFSPTSWQSMHDGVLMVLADWHRQHPESLGPSDAQLAAALDALPRMPLLRTVLATLTEEGKIRRAGLCLCLQGHVARLSEADAALLDRVAGILQTIGLRPPIVGELARMLEVEQTGLIAFLERCATLGHLVRVARNRFFLAATVDALIRIAQQLASESPQGSFDAASYRDRTGIGRNLTIEVLEFLDRVRVTRFAGGRRRLA